LERIKGHSTGTLPRQLSKSANATEIRGAGNYGPSALQSSSTAKMAVASLEEPGKAMVEPVDQHHRLGKVTVPDMHDPYDRQRQPCQVLA
jgi:hypothetical protein